MEAGPSALPMPNILERHFTAWSLSGSAETRQRSWQKCGWLKRSMATYLPTRFTDPSHIAAVAHLFGLDMPSIDAVRVVEIGCGTGENLIAFAERHPTSRCVGVDPSAASIARARQLAATARVLNIDFVVAGVERWRNQGEAIDILIANAADTAGPPETRSHLLALCERDLAANGVALFGYDTFPGAAAPALLEDAVRYLAGDGADAPDARDAILDFLRRGDEEPKDDRPNPIAAEAARALAQASKDAESATPNTDDAPIYFHDFVDRAAAYGLHYIWDAVPGTGYLGGVSGDLAHAATEIGGDPIRIGQALDYVQNRRRRQSILCRSATVIDHAPSADRLADCYLAADTRPAATGDSNRPLDTMESTNPMSFRDRRGRVLTVENRATAAALERLGEMWPRSIRYAALTDDMFRTLGTDAADAADAAQMGNDLLDLFFRGWIRLWRSPPPVGRRGSKKPRALGIARAQAAETDRVVNAHNACVRLDAEERRLLGGLDGHRDSEALVAEGYAAADTLPSLLAGLAAKAVLAG